MENKFQEALEHIKEDIHYISTNESIDKLQELIDNYEEQVRYKDLSVLEHKKNEKLEKALDIVCDILEHIEKDNCVYCPFDQKICVDKEQIGGGYCKANCWKEYAINKAKEELENGK